MTIFDAISRSQYLLKQLTGCEPDKHATLVSQLASELKIIHSLAEQMQGRTNPSQPSAKSLAEIDPQSGCYRFENEQAYYCPLCFDNSNQRVATKRLNSRLRVCPNCRASIKPAR
jgi:hypothetical protein